MKLVQALPATCKILRRDTRREYVQQPIGQPSKRLATLGIVGGPIKGPHETP